MHFFVQVHYPNTCWKQVFFLYISNALSTTCLKVPNTFRLFNTQNLPQQPQVQGLLKSQLISLQESHKPQLA